MKTRAMIVVVGALVGLAAGAQAQEAVVQPAPVSVTHEQIEAMLKFNRDSGLFQTTPAISGYPTPSDGVGVYKIRIFVYGNVESREPWRGMHNPNVYSDGVAGCSVIPVAPVLGTPSVVGIPPRFDRYRVADNSRASTGGVAPGYFLSAFQADRAGQQPEPKPVGEPAAEVKKTAPASPPAPAQPTLDDLLGIKPKAPAGAPDAPKGDKPDGEPGGNPDPGAADLDRLLTVAEMGDAFKQAVDLMGDAATRLDARKDPGLDTQRVQEDVIRRLDQLIASMAKKQQKGDPNQKPQPGDPKQDPGQQQGKGKPQSQSQEQKGGTGQSPGMGPTLQQGTLRPELESARAAWGSLPARIRDMLMQGTEDRFSARYKALTQEYYKRLAEENSK